MGRFRHGRDWGPKPDHRAATSGRQGPAGSFAVGAHCPYTFFNRRTTPVTVIEGAHIKMAKYVYFFGGGKADGNGKMKELLGGKGANLAEMCLIGLPVPAGFTITTEVCTYYYANGKTYPKELKAEVDAALRQTE